MRGFPLEPIRESPADGHVARVQAAVVGPVLSPPRSVIGGFGFRGGHIGELTRQGELAGQVDIQTGAKTTDKRREGV